MARFPSAGACHRSSGTLRERFPSALPAYLSEEDLEFYSFEFERTGFTGALNRFRASEDDWRDLRIYAGQPIAQPSLFIGGRLDATTTTLLDATKAFPETMPGNRGVHLLDCGHWVQQERPDEVNRLLIEWLAGLPHR
ncbi:MAG: epoxide hydrolase [Nocardia sp.]|uniref:alpha/beta fold hydrolase n=1 Tax=Nocardia sp. TaxID=1821 RepID=UPI002602C909|nr:alpha/beta hydrolase [Nocardia sp.]MCU1648062.1 epoxide hydrolase [Nocardia sp.]